MTEEVEQIAKEVIEKDDLREAREFEESIESLYDLAKKYENTKRPPQIRTGIRQIDLHFGRVGELGGLEVCQLIGVGGEPEAGKSTVLERIIDNVSEGYKCVFYTLEFSPRDYAERYQKSIADRHKNIKVLPDESDINEVERQIGLFAKLGYKFFVIDSQMKLTSPGKEGVEATKDVFLRLKNLARIHELIIFIIVQSSKKSHENKKREVYGSILAEHELNQFWFLSSDKEKRETTIEFVKNKQNGNYRDEVISWEPEYSVENKDGTIVGNPEIIEYQM